MAKPASIDEYIALYPADTQRLLQKIRALIQEAAPGAKEKIAYGIPTFTLNGNLIHFAAYKNHIGLYPTPAGLEAFKEELVEFKNARGSVQFRLDKELPINLIERIVAYRIEKNKTEGATVKEEKRTINIL